MMFAQIADEPFIRWDWVGSHLDDIWARTVEHIQLTVVAVAVGFVIAMALSLIALRWHRTYAPITWVSGILYTIPSLALFALLVPWTGLSFLTAEIGLVGYTLLIMVRNIVAGVTGVSPEVREAAIGMGYTRARMLWEIELPLALPTIIAGVRIAAVTTVGLVTVTALITLGGLGSFILRGLQRFFTTEILVGVVMSVLLAVTIDLVLVGVEKALTPPARSKAGS